MEQASPFWDSEAEKVKYNPHNWKPFTNEEKWQRNLLYREGLNYGILLYSTFDTGS